MLFKKLLIIIFLDNLISPLSVWQDFFKIFFEATLFEKYFQIGNVNIIFKDTIIFLKIPQS